MTIFIIPPSIEELRNRLRNRGTESEEEIKKRIARASEEMSYKDQFDFVVVNDNLDTAINDTKKIISREIDK